MDHGLPAVAVRKLDPAARYGLRTALFGLAVVLVAIPFGILLQQVLSDGALTRLDSAAARWLNERVRDNGAALQTLNVISFMGKPIFLFFVVGAPVVWLWHRGARRLATFLTVTCVGGAIVDTLVKLAVGRPRPSFDEPVSHAFGASFPSGHSMGAVFCFGSLLLAFLPSVPRRGRRWLVAATVVLCLAIGASRLGLGVHYLTDILGGFVLGVAWLAASVAAFEIWREDRGRRPTAAVHEGVEPEEARALVHEPAPS